MVGLCPLSEAQPIRLDEQEQFRLLEIQAEFCKVPSSGTVDRAFLIFPLKTNWNWDYILWEMLDILAAVMFGPILFILSHHLPPVSRFESLPPGLSLCVAVNQNEPRKENITESIRPRFWCATSSVDLVWHGQCFTLSGAVGILDIVCHSKRGFVLWAKCVTTVGTVSHSRQRWQRLDNRLPWSKPHTSSSLAWLFRVGWHFLFHSTAHTIRICYAAL